MKWFKKKEVITLPNKYTVYQKIINTINSCRTERHLNCVDNLINNFGIMFPTDSYLFSNLLELSLLKRDNIELNQK